jgi:ubiquinone/menaquinone biosynthesis C-methylase UbiE
MNNRYTFGDDDRAAARLLRLAQTYERVTRDLLARGGIPGCRIAVDLGCGVGWSTRLLRDVLRPVRTVGLDASERFIAEARRRHGPELEFELHDVTRTPLPVGPPDLLLCRFLLTHLRNTVTVLSAWAAAASPRARLLVNETESLRSPHPALARYYDLVERLQGHYGQAFSIGAHLDETFARSPWKVIDSRAIALEIPATRMAELHLANLRTWRTDEYAKRSFDGGELDALERTLERIVTGEESAGMVSNTVRQVVAAVTV